MTAHPLIKDTYKVLVIGVGSIGERHVRCFLNTARAAVSICEINHDLREKVRSRYNIEQAFAGIDAALAQSHDVAVIAVPADLHIPLAQRAVNAGLHVLIEKPLSVSWDGVDELMQAVHDKGLVASVAYVHRSHPALAAMRKAIVSGSFGQPVELVAVAGQHFPTYRPGYRETYYASRASGGGAIQDALTHIINAGEWLIGPIDRVVADADHKILPGVSVEDVVHVLARHGNVLASYSLNQFQSPNEITITVVCERGTARFEHHHHRWRWMLRPETPWHDESSITVQRDDHFVRQANEFLDAVAGREPPLCSLEEGMQTLRVNLAILNSVESQTWQQIAQDGRKRTSNMSGSSLDQDGS
jgi:predicted dehydrogenase